MISKQSNKRSLLQEHYHTMPQPHFPTPSTTTTTTSSPTTTTTESSVITSTIAEIATTIQEVITGAVQNATTTNEGDLNQMFNATSEVVQPGVDVMATSNSTITELDSGNATSVGNAITEATTNLIANVTETAFDWLGGGNQSTENGTLLKMENNNDLYHGHEDAYLPMYIILGAILGVLCLICLVLLFIYCVYKKHNRYHNHGEYNLGNSCSTAQFKEC